MSSLRRLVLWHVMVFAAFLVGVSSAHGEEMADVGFIGLHGGIFESLREHARPLGLKLKYFEDGDISQQSADLSRVRVLYVQHTREEDREAYFKLISQARKNNPDLKVIVFARNSGEFLKTIGLENDLYDDSEASTYYGSSSENLRRLLLYTGAKYLGKGFNIEPPEDVIREGFYHPDHEEMFLTAGEFLVWKRKTNPGLDVESTPRLLIAVHGTHLAFQQPRVVDALIREAERQGAIAVGIIDGRSPEYEERAVSFDPHAVIHTCHSSDPLPMRLKLDVPHLHSIFIRKQSIAQWQASNDGLASSELAFHVIGQELIGAIEPQVAAGTTLGQGSSEAFQPIPDRVEHLIKRALSMSRLAKTPSKEKKIAIIYYDRELGKGELMRGSATGMHMNGPRSLINVLGKMKAHGYQIAPVPQHEDELLGWMMERGRQIGVWAPGELDKLAKNGSPALVPVEKYRQWYEAKVPEDRRKQLEERWGPAPGRFMVWQNQGKQFIVIPKIELENILLLPQPLRGEVHGKEDIGQQMHDKTTAPPHNYLATYFWLEEEYGANALVHFGTHGSEFALPGKPTGLSRRDWPDIAMGAMPNFNPWIIENMVESSPVRRRVYGTLIDHLSPPIVDAGLSDELENLHEMLDKWSVLEDGPLKQRFQMEISRQTRQTHLDVDLKLTFDDEQGMSPEQVEAVSKYLHDIQEETTPTSLHIFGEPPRQDLLVPYLVNILRSPFLKSMKDLIEQAEDLKHEKAHENNLPHSHDHDGEHQVRPMAESIIRLVVEQSMSPQDAVSAIMETKIDPIPEVIDKGLGLVAKLNLDFKRTTDEIDNLLRGLEGGFVPPGPGNSPIRNPGVVPTGRNMYLLNPEEVPTKPSWELGSQLAEELIDRHQKQHGEFPTKIGFDLRSSATFRDYGVMEAQILYLLGVEPIWDDRQLVNDVRLIPRNELGRPRIDVFIASGGWYDSNLPSRLNLWDKAIRLVCAADEPDNPLFKNTQDLRRILAEKGLPPSRAELLSAARIFGRHPARENGGFLFYRVQRSGDWGDRDDIVEQYLANHKYVYTEGAWGEEASQLYDAAIQGTHTVVRSWSDHMTGPLASKYTWLHGGSLSFAVEKMTGKRPDYIFSDVRDPDKAGIVDAEDALRKEYRVRLFNRKWLEGMMKEGYAGADHMRVMVSNSFGWEVMRPGSVGNANWYEMKAVLIDDKLNLHLEGWMEKENPYARQDALAVMMEAIRKGYWEADEQTRRELAQHYARSVARHGLSGHITSGGNAALDKMIRRELEQDSEVNKELLASYASQINEQNLPEDRLLASAAPGTIPISVSATMSSSESDKQTEQEPSSGQAKAEAITGSKLEPKSEQVPKADNGNDPQQNLLWVFVSAIVITLMASGFFLRRGSA